VGVGKCSGGDRAMARHEQSSGIGQQLLWSRTREVAYVHGHGAIIDAPVGGSSPTAPHGVF
jgi:hypothetical protein